MTAPASAPDDAHEAREALKERLLAAYEAQQNEADQILFFDPYLSVVSPPARWPRMEGGYKIWPETPGDAPVRLRLMTIGNSTSLWPAYPWSLELGQALEAAGHGPVEVWHGAGKGGTSSQEVLRVLRDAPAIRPDLIVSLSGICDIGYLLNQKGQPHKHKYARRVMDFAAQAGIVGRGVFYGPEDDPGTAAIWCRHQRFMRALADEMGIPILTFLQPVMGAGGFTGSEEEQAMFAAKKDTVLRGNDAQTYGESVTEFYDGVHAIIAADPAAHAHVVDLTGAFDGMTGVYRDHRHQTPEGVSHLARTIRPHVERILALTRSQETTT